MKNFKLLSLALIVFAFFSCNSDDSTEEVPNIDLEATSITFSVEPLTDFTGNVTITGTITNIGDDFSSSQGQQSIFLYEKPLGITSIQPEHLVASMEFETLNTNETQDISYTRSWSATTEFPPDYILVISYDPDIYIDDNDNNDDANIDNDSIIVNGAAINDLF